MEQLLDQLGHFLIETLGVARYQVVLRDISGTFSAVRSYPASQGPTASELRPDSPLFQWARAHPEGAVRISARIPADVRGQLETLNAETALPLMAGAMPLGAVLFSETKPIDAMGGAWLSLLARLLSQAVYQWRRSDELEWIGYISKGIAHDLQSLFTPISAFLQLAKEKPASAAELLSVAQRNLELIQAYIKQAAAFAASGAGAVRQVNVAEVLRKAARIFQAQFETKKIQVNIQAPPDAPIESDEILLVRLVGNFLANAIEASPEGGRLWLGARLVPLETGPTVRIEIRDEGTGLDVSSLREQPIAYLGQKEEASGIGLIICRQIVEWHGGRMEITSSPEKGTAVTVDLPAPPLATRLEIE